MSHTAWSSRENARDVLRSQTSFVRILLALFFLCLLCLGTHLQITRGQAHEQFKIATYNVMNWGQTGRVINGEFHPHAMKPRTEREAVVKILRELDADVLVLQEIVLEKDDINVRDILSSLFRAGLEYPHWFLSSGEDHRIGILVLSRLPFEEARSLNTDEFRLRDKSGRQLVMRAQRGFAHVAVQPAPDVRLDILGIHLKSRLPHPELRTDEKNSPGHAQIRKQEALLLRRYVESLLRENSEAKIIILGDFNDTTRHKNDSAGPVEIVLGRPPDSPQLVLLEISDNVGDMWTHYYPAHKSYERIDLILVTQNLASQFIPQSSWIYRQHNNAPDWSKASDHRAVLATFDFSSKR